MPHESTNNTLLLCMCLCCADIPSAGEFSYSLKVQEQECKCMVTFWAQPSCSTIAFLADALNGWIFSWVSLWCQWPVWIHRSNLAYAVAGLTLKPELRSRKQKAHLLTWLYLESCCSEYWKSTKYYHRQNVSTQGISLNLLQFNIRR